MVIRIRKLRRAAFLASMFLFLSIPPEVRSEDVESLLGEVDAAVSEESYSRAIAILEEGKKRWPGDRRIFMRAGKLYKDRDLYGLALAEFKEAETLAPEDPEILYQIAETHGYLGDNADSVEVFESLLGTVEDDDFRGLVVSDLSWMYFKTYRMREGISLLESELEKGFDRNLAHTLGTLYSGIYDREKSREWYERSIADALDHGDEYFASIAHYNLALLEFASYRFDEAREEALRSLELRSRAGGHMVVGELDTMAWDLSSALQSYRTAESMDHTPLSKVDMASFYRRIGRLDEAIRFAGEISADPDVSWMYHFGVDEVRFGIDLNEIFSEAWAGKAATEAMTPRAGLVNRARSFANRIAWRAKAEYYDRKYRRLVRGYAGELERNGNELDAAWNSYTAARGYRRIALRRLEKARILETSIMEAAVPWYDLETGWEKGDAEALVRALKAFRPSEGDPRERALRGLAGGVGGRVPDDLRSESMAALYRMNPGGFRQYGLALPTEVAVAGPGSGRLRRRIGSLLRRAGYEVFPAGKGGPATARFTVSLSEGGACDWYLAGPDGSTRASAESGGTLRREDIASVLAELLDGFYRTPLDLREVGGGPESGGADAHGETDHGGSGG